MEFRTLSGNSPENDPELIKAWTKAAAASGSPDPFCCTPAWQLAFHESFSPARRVLLETDGTNVFAFAEAAFNSGQVCLAPLESHWFSGCPLLGPSPEKLFARALLFLAHSYRTFLPAVVLSGLETGSLLPVRLEAYFGRMFRFLPQPGSRQRSASLAGGLDGYLSRRSAGFRAAMRKAGRRAAVQGVRFEQVIPESPQEADAAYARMLDVEGRSWKGIGRCGMAEPPSREFYRSMLQRLSLYRGARVMFAVREEQDIGFIFGGLCGGHYRGQQFSYDNAWKKFSIGDLLQMEQLARLCDEGVECYDMGMSDHPSMEYKKRWAEDERELCTVILLPFRRSAEA